MKLTKDQIINGIVKPCMVLIAFALSFIANKEEVDEVISTAAASLDEVKAKLEAGVTQDEAIEAGFAVAETITGATETKVDDAVEGTIKSLYEAFKSHGGGLIAAIKGWIQIHKAAKAEGK